MTREEKLHIFEWIGYIIGSIIISIRVDVITAIGVYLIGMSCAMAWSRINKE